MRLWEAWFLSGWRREEIANIQVVARDPDLDFSILKSSQPKPLVPPWKGRPDDLEVRDDLGLASYRLGIYEYQEGFKNKLGFTKALC
ncbi:unnamed protein product [Phytophthora fragariaefolia]|uniref:Unnamed protein product n=1 Tax=Phytophthora fragariaefolia TaxID=1490495 RepID=A0A9W6U2L7_9STRA|nr:unnamed protein product [Phytophthora fragariaefolia]